MYFYLSIGSNIEPEKNAVAIAQNMGREFGPFLLYPFYYTEPENIATKSIFLNSLAVVFSSFNETELKQKLNAIEVKLGRDRKDPERSKKDRTADIDILGFTQEFDSGFFNKYKKTYVANIVNGVGRRAELEGMGLPTQRAATVNFDARTGHVCILQNTHDSLKDRHKSTLLG